MNPLAALKQKLMVKPNVEEREQVAVVIKGVKTQQKPKAKAKPKVQFQEKEEKSVVEEILEEKTIEEKKGPLIVDETNKGYDRAALFKKLLESKKLKVSIKPVLNVSEEKKMSEPIPLPPAQSKAVKIGVNRQLIIEGDDDQEEEYVLKPKEKEKNTVKITVPKKKVRITEKAEKGVAILGPETLVEIGDTDLRKRMPKRLPLVKIKVSSYYMNNREIFINFINSLFEPYRQELAKNKESISCETIGKTSSDFSLLTHQEIVRDYMNLYTPYRGLLLYHGLGSGKTCSSIAIAEGMKGPKKIIIMTPKSLRRNYMEELKKCGDLMYKKDQFWEFIPAQPNSEIARILSSILNLPMEYIKKKKGAWFVNITKPSNYAELTPIQASSLEDQLDAMIESKYMFINYNGLRAKRLEELTSGFTRNLFDNSVVIIDEAHNLVSRIVNKIKKEPLINEIKRGDQERASRDLSKKLSDMLEKIPTISGLSEKKIVELNKELKEILLNVRANREINDEERSILDTNINIFLKAIKKIDDPTSIQRITDIQEPIAIIITRLQTNPVLESRVGEKEFLPKHLSSKLYEYLLSAKDAKIVLLTGTPVINYPNEFGILFNILRGYIKTWEFPISDATTRSFSKDDIIEMLKGEKSLDYIDYDQNLKYLTITRNPFGFKNKIKKDEGYKGVTNAKEVSRGVLDIDTSSFDSDTEFEKRIIGILKRNNIDVLVAGIKINNKKALPDTLDLFEGQYIDNVTKQIKNLPALNRRILGLSSYFRSAQESLLPRFTRTIGRDYHIVKIPMSNFQFKIYEAARIKERKTEKPKRLKILEHFIKNQLQHIKFFHVYTVIMLCQIDLLQVPLEI